MLQDNPKDACRFPLPIISVGLFAQDSSSKSKRGHKPKSQKHKVDTDATSKKHSKKLKETENVIWIRPKSRNNALTRENGEKFKKTDSIASDRLNRPKSPTDALTRKDGEKFKKTDSIASDRLNRPKSPTVFSDPLTKKVGEKFKKTDSMVSDRLNRPKSPIVLSDPLTKKEGEKFKKTDSMVTDRLNRPKSPSVFSDLLTRKDGEKFKKTDSVVLDILNRPKSPDTLTKKYSVKFKKTDSLALGIINRPKSPTDALTLKDGEKFKKTDSMASGRLNRPKSPTDALTRKYGEKFKKTDSMASGRLNRPKSPTDALIQKDGEKFKKVDSMALARLYSPKSPTVAVIKKDDEKFKKTINSMVSDRFNGPKSPSETLTKKDSEKFKFKKTDSMVSNRLNRPKSSNVSVTKKDSEKFKKTNSMVSDRLHRSKSSSDEYRRNNQNQSITSRFQLLKNDKQIKTILEAVEAVEADPSFTQIESKRICIVGMEYFAGMSQEPWPKDVKLYQPYEVEQILLPDNANCLAVQAFLRMCKLDFQVVCRANAEFMSPSGKVPFLKCGAFIVSELEGIVQFVNNKGITLTSAMESEQKSDMRAYMSLVHNVLENAELYLCWCDKETYNEVTKPRNGSVYPWPLNHYQTWSKRSTVCKRLKMLGWYNKSLDDVYQEVENCCQALTDRLEGKEYFFGKKYTEMDALVYGHIYSILTAPQCKSNPYKFASIIKNYDKLLYHCKLIHKEVMKRDSSIITSLCTKMVTSEPDSNVQSDTDVDDIKRHETSDSEVVVTADSESDTPAGCGKGDDGATNA